MTENKNISTSLNKVAFETVDVFEIIKKILDGDSDGICLLCSDLEGCWQLFKSQFKIQKAAGGKVLNFKNEVLFIYRFNKWDLPKGKLEKGESIEECAVREVEEECGITNLSIENELDTTFHIFERNNTVILKITYWFLMKTTYNEKLTPQLEEGIEQVVFKNKIETEDALKNTYENIKLLFL